jgi:hypothetical protein
MWLYGNGKAALADLSRAKSLAAEGGVFYKAAENLEKIINERL